MADTADVVVIGAGAVGSACAYLLARAGLTVKLLEREAIASGSSTHATGYLSLLSADFRDEPYLELGVEGFHLTNKLVPELEEITGMDLLHQVKPSMRIAIDEDEEEIIRREFSWQSKHVSAEWISPAQVLEVDKRITPAVRGALYEPRSAQLDSARYTLALATASEALGAEILLRRVTGLTTRDGRIVGVQHTTGQISCATVVIAMGVWSPAVSQWANVRIPVKPLKGERLQLRMDGPPLGAMLMSPRRGHLISRRDGFLSVGSTAGRDVDDMRSYLLDTPSEGLVVRPSEEALMELLTRAHEVLPSAIENAEVVQQLAGVRPLSPDRRALIGPVDSAPGLLLATGHGTKGIHLAAVSGRIIQDLVVNPKSADTVPDCVRADRFTLAGSEMETSQIFSVED